MIARVDQIEALIDLKRYDEAQKELVTQLASAPDDVNLLFMLSRVLLCKEDYVETKRTLLKYLHWEITVHLSIFRVHVLGCLQKDTC